jgi:pimeloyl-ACP methyl ester carboxylesterase
MPTANPDHDFAKAAGHRLRLRRIGSWKAGLPVLVFLHEGLGSITQWRDFPDELAAACALPALVYERYGHGGSDPVTLPRPDDYLEIEADQALPDLLAACGIERPILVGHSDGGTIALLFAASRPDVPLACVTLAAHVLFEPETRKGVAGVMATWERDPGFRQRLARHHGDRTQAMFLGWAETWLREERRSWSMLHRLPAIRCPVLAIQGDDDEHGTPLQVEKITSLTAGPADALMIPACGHAPHLEARPLVQERIRSFVADVIGPEPLNPPAV